MCRARIIPLIATGLLALAGCAGTSPAAQSPGLAYADDLRGAVFDPPRVLDDFSLMATTGETFTLSNHHGQIILLYFGYRTCPDFCPMTFTELRQIYLELDEPADQVKVVFVTVDPERDDLPVLTAYTQGFHQDFIGLRGEGDSLKNVMDQFGVIAERQQLADSPLSYLIDHTASLFLIGPDGRLQAQYLYGTDFRDILHDVRLILQTL
jgi:protein SCO1